MCILEYQLVVVVVVVVANEISSLDITLIDRGFIYLVRKFIDFIKQRIFHKVQNGRFY
jgi:hypothetical protein